MTEPVGLYIHIPFCDAKCSYCDFVTFTDRHAQVDAYLDAVIKEISLYEGWPVRTLFVGGGTPTVLSPEQIERLFTAIHNRLDLSPLTEATVEANPESASIDRLSAYRSGGINRLSLGLQTTNDQTLGQLGRLHNRAKFFCVYNAARALGFDNINVDLMFGLPGQDLRAWNQSLEDVASVAPDHVSAYALKVEPATRLGKEGFQVDSDLEADMYLAASSFLKSRGYEHYEISNFAKPGFESRHNLLYWENQNTIGVGISSTSYLNGRRFKNTPHLQVYLDSMRDGRPALQEEAVLEDAERAKESVMLALRLKRGVRSDILETLQIPMLKTFLDSGLAVFEKGMYSLTPRGWLLSNLLFQQFV